MNKDMLFCFENITKEYEMGELKVKALNSVSFCIPKGELVVILGPSGSGKSTLLNIMGGMDLATCGKMYFDGLDISLYTKDQLTHFRRESIGFVFQFYNLMHNLTARENVELATEISNAPLDINEVLHSVGLQGREDHFPAQLSGGEQQRVAIARAVAKNPSVLLCDEPTGALDFSTGIRVLKLLSHINKETGKTIIIITHNQPIAQMADRIIKMRSGEIFEIINNDTPLDPEKIEW